MEKILVKISTPSRICLFGEHQDYLGLEVIAQAVNLRFYSQGSLRDDGILSIKMSGENISVSHRIDIRKKITYNNKRDYIKSSLNVLKQNGYAIDCGFDIEMTSKIPIGKGMCSSSTMIVVFLRTILELIGHPDKDDKDKLSYIAYKAEVLEFEEPGGMMDHYTSVYGNLLHIDCQQEHIDVHPIDYKIPGKFILIDTGDEKDTVLVLANAKDPVIEAMKRLKKYGINSIIDLINSNDLSCLHYLDINLAKKVRCQVSNHLILREAKAMLNGSFNMEHFGELIYQHHINLRNGLGISTDKVEEILTTAINAGALGGKINGSGGGGCCFVYAKDEDIDNILEEISRIGYEGLVLSSDQGTSRDS